MKQLKTETKKICFTIELSIKGWFLGNLIKTTSEKGFLY